MSVRGVLLDWLQFVGLIGVMLMDPKVQRKHRVDSGLHVIGIQHYIASYRLCVRVHAYMFFFTKLSNVSHECEHVFMCIHSAQPSNIFWLRPCSSAIL